MFDISENGREAVLSHFKKAFKDKQNIEPPSQTYENEIHKPIKKSRLKNLILTKSLIVK
ncbi:MAG: hypothetical protein ACI8PD_001636 [Nitrospinales bacterium]|jgi:hypothetical protein